MKSKEQESLAELRKVAKEVGLLPIHTFGEGGLKVLLEVLHKLDAKECILKPDSKGGMTVHIVFKPNYSEHFMYVDDNESLFFRGSEKDASNSDVVCNKILMALIDNFKQREREFIAERNICNSVIERYRKLCANMLEGQIGYFFNFDIKVDKP